MKRLIPILIIALAFCACRTTSNNDDTSNVALKENVNEELYQERDRVHELATKGVLRDSIYYELLDIDFDGTDEYLSYYIAGAYVLATYDVYELCGESLIMKKALNNVHDHFFIDQNTRFDTINKQIINHFNSGCCEYVEYVYQADEKGKLSLIYDERVKWDYDKQEPVSEITYYQ
jgi:hypothetical protein